MSRSGQMALASGGSGGAAKVEKTIPCGTYSYTVGSGGNPRVMWFQSINVSYNCYVFGEDGGQTRFGDIVATGGGGGAAVWATPSGGTGGTGQINGNSGRSMWLWGDVHWYSGRIYSVLGAASPLGITAGASREVVLDGTGSVLTRTCLPGNPGCIHVRYVGPDE